MIFGKASELRTAFAPISSALVPAVVISAFVNVLLLVGSFFMLLVYDEVLPSRSAPTLAGLLGIVAIAFGFLALLEALRSQITSHLSAITTSRLSGRVLDIAARFELTNGPTPSGSQPIRDLDIARGFIAGPGPLAFLDLPWVILFLVVLFLFHWSLAALTLLGVGFLIGLMLSSERLTAKRVEAVTANTSSRLRATEDIRRNADILRAMGGLDAQRARWLALEDEGSRLQGDMSRTSGIMSAVTKSFRLFLQSLVLALGAYLVLSGEATPGIIIAGSILSSRALAPIEQVIAHWKHAVGALQALQRLDRMLESVPLQEPLSQLPLPSQSLVVRKVSAGPPGGAKATIADINFSANAGDGIAVIGRSGSGKSSLAKVISGVWSPARGDVRLDGASLDQYGEASLGRIFGYVPQTISLMPGTIAQNIARFDPRASMDAVLAASRSADLHEFILGLEGGYDHKIQPGGSSLSAGQLQRVALARALYGNPFVLVLDEPNSNLDAQGEQALGRAILEARGRGAIVIMVAHRSSVLSYMSHVLMMDAGMIEKFETVANARGNDTQRKKRKRHFPGPVVRTGGSRIGKDAPTAPNAPSEPTPPARPQAEIETTATAEKVSRL
ncbi:MAG: type I secretion system permease/ATPase [Pseudomonadota bacterium]